MWNWKCPGEVEHFCAWTLPLSCQVSSWLHSFHKDELRLLCIRQCWSENESHRDRQLIYYQPPSTQKHRRGVAQCLTPRRTTLGLKCEFSKLAEWESIPDFGNQCQISEIKASFLLIQTHRFVLSKCLVLLSTIEGSDMGPQSHTSTAWTYS